MHKEIVTVDGVRYSKADYGNFYHALVPTRYDFTVQTNLYSWEVVGPLSYDSFPTLEAACKGEQVLRGAWDSLTGLVN